MAFTTSLDVVENTYVHVSLFENVSNVPAVRQDVIGGRCTAALISPRMVVGERQLTTAACKAAHCLANDRLKTRSVYTELIYWLSPTTGISNALKQFGSSDQDTSIIVAVIDDCQGDEKAEEVFSRVEGTRVPLSRLSQVCDSAAAKKHFQVSDKEVAFSSLEDSIITRMMAKEAV